MKRYLILLLALQILGCSGAKEDGAPTVTQKTSENTVIITPDTATARSVITLKADSSLLTSATIDWHINGNVAESSGSTRFTSSELSKGDTLQAILTKNQKKYHSNEIRIMNTPPRINRAGMVPALPKVGDILRIEVDAQDVDGDKIYYRYKWTLNNKHISDQDYLDTEFKRDDMIVVEIITYDSESTGSKIFVKNKIYNTPPAMTESGPDFDGKTYTYNINATDIDGDELTYEIIDGPKGMSIDPAGKITWEAGSNAGTYEFKVHVNDNKGGELIVPITTRLSFEE